MNISDWYQSERQKISRRDDRPPLLIGGMVYGKWFVNMFLDWCLPSIRASQGDAKIIVCTRNACAGRLVSHGVGVWIMPEEIMDDSGHNRFQRLAAVQSLLMAYAAENGMAFHPMMADHVYSRRYFRNLRRIGMGGNVIQAGLNASGPGASEALLAYRSAAGELCIAAHNLAAIGWQNTVMNCMNGASYNRLPDEHYQLWRARDRLMLFNPYSNPVYITPETCRMMVDHQAPTATLDARTMAMFGANFRVPSVNDDMVCLALSDAQPLPANNWTTRAKWVSRAGEIIQHQRWALIYYMTPTELPLPIDEKAPTAEEVTRRQWEIVREII